MITIGHLKISVAIVLLLGWAIFGNSKCVPKKKMHVSKYYTVVTMTGGEVSTQTITVDSLPTTGTNSTNVSSLDMPSTMSSSGSSALSSSLSSAATTMQSSTDPLASSSPSPSASAASSSSAAAAAASPSAPMPSGSAPPGSSSLAASGSTAPSGASATPSDSSSSSSSAAPTGNMQQGTASYYTEWKSNPGSCGFIPSDGNIAAVNPQFMPAKCKKCIMINYNGKSLKVQATDTCPGCAAGQIDLSDVAFQQLDSLSKGKLTIQWGWVDC